MFAVVLSMIDAVLPPRVILSETPPEIPLHLRLVLLGQAPKVRLRYASLRMTRGGVQSKPKRSAGRPTRTVGADLAA